MGTKRRTRKGGREANERGVGRQTVGRLGEHRMEGMDVGKNVTHTHVQIVACSRDVSMNVRRSVTRFKLEFGVKRHTNHRRIAVQVGSVGMRDVARAERWKPVGFQRGGVAHDISPLVPAECCCVQVKLRLKVISIILNCRTTTEIYITCSVK